MAVTTVGSSSTTSSADTSSPTYGQPFSIQLNSAGANKHKRDISVVGYVNGTLTRVTSTADAVSFVLTSDGVLMIFGTGLVVGFSGNPGTSPLMIYPSVSALPTTIIWSFTGGALVMPGAGFCVDANNVMSVSVGGATDSGCAPVTPVPNTDPDSYNTEVASSITPSPQTTTSTSLGSTSSTVDASTTASSSLLTTTTSTSLGLSSTTGSSSLTTTTAISSSTSLTTTVYVSITSTTSLDSTTSGGAATTSTTTATKTEETSGPNCSILPLEDQTAPDGTQYTQFFYSCHAAIPATLGSSYSIATSGNEDYSSDPTAFLSQCVANAEQLGAGVWTYYQSSLDFKWHCSFWIGLTADDGFFVDDSTVVTMNAMKVVGDDDSPSITTTSSSSTTPTSTTTTIGVMATVPASAPICTPDSSYFDHVHCPDVYIYDSVQECQCFNRVQGGQNMCAYTFYYDRPCMWDSECAVYGEWSYCLTASFTGTGAQGYCSDNDSSKTCLTGGYQANTTTPSAIFSTPTVTSSTMTTTSSSAPATETCAGLCSTKTVSSGSHVWSQVEAGCVEYNFNWVWAVATPLPAGVSDCDAIQYCADYVVQQGMTAFRTFWVPAENQWHCDAGLENDETGDYEYSPPQANFYMYNLVSASTPSTTAATTTTSSVTSTTSPANCVQTSASVGDILTTTNGNSWVNFFSSGCGLSLDWQSLNFNNLYVYLRTDYTYEEALLECASIADSDGSPVFEFETDTRNNNRWVCWTLNDISNDPAQFQPYGGIADAYGWYLPSRMVLATPTTTTTPPTPAPTCDNGAIFTDTNGDAWETLCGQGSYYGWTFFSSYSDVATLSDCIDKCNEDASCNAVSIEYRDAPNNNLCGFIYTSIEFQPYDFEADTAIKVSGTNARPPINVANSSPSTTSRSTSSTTTASATSTTTPPPACTASAIGHVTALYDTTQTFRNFYTGCGESMEGGTTGGLANFPNQFATMWRASANWEDYTFDQAVSRCVQFAVDNGATAVEFYVDVNQNWLCVGVNDVTVDDSSFYVDSNVVNVWGFVWENSCQNAPLNDITAADGTIFAEFFTGCSTSFQGNTPGGLVNLNRVVSVNWQAPDYSGYTFDAAVQKCADTTISQGGNLFEFYIGTDDWWYCIAVNDLPATTASFYPDATIGKVWGFAITEAPDVCEPSQLAESVQLANGTTYEEFYDACHVSLQGDTAGGVGWMTTVFGFNNLPGDDGNYGGWTLQTALELCIRDASAAGATVIEYYENTDEVPTRYCFGVNNVPALEDSFHGDGTVGRLWAFKLDESTLPILLPL
ncbi:hypothetical protein G647_06505 [Cladophialophora carrionii CBS 160.54]|uniref:DUF7908 domain-containing protein n=1 Tax=Cladophialophora carrionii CBS 160.54 TaxID=1279043 RepID=V9D6D9_9EURO|nr:uncharacterized protein G647_06505 [Cladophialophora carrionii CBS 160.54]ETI22430.1 hypothetical protein G647_06505 [Cladophialophora carrionii CBS 160.54]